MQYKMIAEEKQSTLKPRRWKRCVSTILPYSSSCLPSTELCTHSFIFPSHIPAASTPFSIHPFLSPIHSIHHSLPAFFSSLVHPFTTFHPVYPTSSSEPKSIHICGPIPYKAPFTSYLHPSYRNQTIHPDSHASEVPSHLFTSYLHPLHRSLTIHPPVQPARNHSLPLYIHSATIYSLLIRHLGSW